MQYILVLTSPIPSCMSSLVSNQRHAASAVARLSYLNWNTERPWHVLALETDPVLPTIINVATEQRITLITIGEATRAGMRVIVGKPLNFAIQLAHRVVCIGEGLEEARRLAARLGKLPPAPPILYQSIHALRRRGLSYEEAVAIAGKKAAQK
jgi:hypothetical protein